MKKLLLLAVTMLAAFTNVKAQDLPTDYKEKEVFRNDEVVFRQIDEHTWLGNGHEYIYESLYLVEGEDRAVLLDAGTTIHDLDKIVAQLTSKPVTFIATHVHLDHTGYAVRYFPEIYINAADTINIAEHMPGYEGTIKYIHEGDIIDLGGRKLEVLFTPGHTPGSTTFMDVESGYGFSGDAFGSGGLLLTLDFTTLAETCRKTDEYITKHGIKYLYPGHYRGMNPETPQRVKDLQKLSEEMISGKLQGEPITYDNMLHLDSTVEAYGVRVSYYAKNMK